MPFGKKLARSPRWYLIPPRIVIITFLLTLLSFGLCLFLGILGTLIASLLQGVHPNMTVAYRYFAVPGAMIIGSIVLVSATIVEIRHYVQTKTLARIANASH
jgi:hypothetical protein